LAVVATKEKAKEKALRREKKEEPVYEYEDFDMEMQYDEPMQLILRPIPV